MPSPLDLDIHGVVGVRVAAGTPTTDQLRTMFAPFVTDEVDRVDITVGRHFEELEEPSYGEYEYTYTDTSVWMRRGNVQIHQVGDGFRVNGSSELLTTLLPLIDRVAVCHEAAMVHAATVEYEGHGVFMPAWGGVGKTSTIAKLVTREGFAFMGDDWAFVSSGGDLLGHAKPTFIKPHHRGIYPHVFAAKRKPLVPSKLSEPLARVATAVHPVITRYPRLAAMTRRWSPEHVIVTPQEAFPDARFSRRAPIAVAVFVERYAGESPSFEPKARDWMTSRVVGNFHAEMALHSRQVVTALSATGLVPAARFFGEKARVVRAAIADKPCYRLRVPKAMSADEASDVIADHIHKALAEVGVTS